MSTLDTHTVLHFGVIALPPMGYASIARHDDPAVETTIRTWGNLSAVAAGTWDEWGTDPDSEYAAETLHVSVDVTIDAARGRDLNNPADLADVAETLHLWLARILDKHSRLMDYAIATDAEWSENARVVTFNSSGPNVWGRARQDALIG